MLSGLLLALSFPKFGQPLIAWVALVPLLIAIDRQSAGRAFLLGLTAGVVHFAGTLYWITNVMVLYGGLGAFVAVLVNLSLILYLSLFPAMFAWTMARLLRGAGPAMLMAAPLVWVATELGRTRLFTGFPWVLLGYSQVTVLPIAQLASVLGVYGVSALVVLVSSALTWALSARVRGARLPLVPLAATLALVASVAIWGGLRVSSDGLNASGETVRVGLIQNNVSLGEKSDPSRTRPIFRSYLAMSRQAAAQGATLVVWPESATPFMFAENLPASEEVRLLARESRASILLGSDQIEHGETPRYFNSAYMVTPEGQTGGVYQKIHLVPFGEYVPLKQLFFFASKLVEAVSDFSAGEQATLLPVGDHRISTSICYEVVYPALVRDFVRGGSELLTTITNDAWFGATSAPYQHFAQASMRAIENGRYLVRAANTGISGIVDPYGRVRAQSGLFQPAVMVGEARFLQTVTIYQRTGDLFAWVALAASAALLAVTRRSYTMKP